MTFHATLCLHLLLVLVQAKVHVNRAHRVAPTTIIHNVLLHHTINRLCCTERDGDLGWGFGPYQTLSWVPACQESLASPGKDKCWLQLWLDEWA